MVKAFFLQTICGGITMGSNDEVPVEYVFHDADTQDILFNDPDINDLEIDHCDTPVVMRGGTSRRMLAGSVMACMGGTLAAGLEARGVTVESLTGKAKVQTSQDFPKRIEAIDIELKLKVPAGNEKVLNKVEKILAKGCMISRSLKPAIKIREVIIRE